MSRAFWTDAEWDEAREERAAIMEYLGGLSRAEAERLAGVAIGLQRLEVASMKVQAQNKAKVKNTGPVCNEVQTELPGMAAPAMVG